MRFEDIPRRVWIRNEEWTILFRSRDDGNWRDAHAWGATQHEDREIHLDENLKFMPALLQDTFLHELLHACLPKTLKTGRPKGITRKAEESLVTTVSDELATVLNQVGWRKP